MALCLITIGLSFLPNLDFSDLSFLGIKPAATDTHGRLIVFTVLWVLMFYHAFFLALHAYDDWEDWLFEVLPEDVSSQVFPELCMYFGRSPSRSITEKRTKRELTDFRWRPNKDGGYLSWELTYKPINEQASGGRMYNLPRAVVRSVRSRVLMFFVADCGLPALLYLAALVATASAWS